MEFLLELVNDFINEYSSNTSSVFVVIKSSKNFGKVVSNIGIVEICTTSKYTDVYYIKKL